MDTENKIAEIESLDSEGRGVAHSNGKVVFVANALPGERVVFQILRNKKQYVVAQAVDILRPSPLRVRPLCPHFGVCGGCSLQHMDAAAQVAVKQKSLEDALKFIGKVRTAQILAPIYGADRHYRFRARMSVKYVAKKGGVLVGFHEKNSPFVADMVQCPVLPQHISALIVPLREMIARLSVRDRLPQIEWAAGADVTVLAMRVMTEPTENDKQILRDFIDKYQSDKNFLQIWLQPGKPDSLYPFYPQNAPQLDYRLPEFNVVMPFHPTEFTQVNPAVNAIMVSRAMKLLAPQPGEKIADMFCGLGNFTLPIARAGAQVLGVEGSEALVARARSNAALNGLSAHTRFQAANLFKEKEFDMAQWADCGKWLIDPPRDGAAELLCALPEKKKPQKIVYISCKPSTLARDAGILAQKGYSLRLAGVMNMFAHTAHVESVAVFTANAGK